jgi:hypothetical protein
MRRSEWEKMEAEIRDLKDELRVLKYKVRSSKRRRARGARR